MGIRILAGTKINEGPGYRGAVLYCSVSCTALPMMFESGDEAQRFIDKHGDVRGLSDTELSELHTEWLKNDRR